jgi:hypothetical protein
MGLDINAVQFLISARKRGAIFGHTLTLGRQHLGESPSVMASLLEGSGFPADKFRSNSPDNIYADRFLEALGATRVDALDNSGFEGATIVHDLNQPFEEHWKNGFDAVIDGGTLEHVFNFPAALKNVMGLPRENGSLFLHTPTNNLCGHGFYQFSPELFFRVFSEDNGYSVERMVIHRIGPYNRWYDVSDPDHIRSRVELITFTPMMLLVQAKRERIKEVLVNLPQQSDYAELWQVPGNPTWKPMWKRFRLLSAVKTAIEFYRRQSLRNRTCFRKSKYK